MSRLAPHEVRVELEHARESFTKGDVQDALRRAERILTVEPACLEAHYGRAMALARLGRPQEAFLSFLEILRLDPTNTEALHWAAVTSLNMRQASEAGELAARLIRLQPKNARAHFLLANAQILLGKLEAALASVESARKIAPLESEYVLAKAQILARLNWTVQAIGCYRRALSLRPSADVAIELAELLVQEGHPQQALATLEPFENSLPASVRTNVLMGRAYTEAQNFEYAAPFWAAAEKTEDVAQVTLARATSEISAGRLELAESLLREEIERTPEGLRLLPPLAAIHQMQPADCGLVEHMELLWTSGNHSPSTRREAAFALGKCFDDLGDYGRAMRYYDEANRLAYELSPLSQQFDTAAWRSYVDFQISFFTKARMAELASNGHESSAPLFIVGMIRSGTTLTEHILSRHSQVRDIGETTFWPDHRGDLLDQNTGWCDKATAYRLAQEYLAMTAGGEARYFTEKNPANVLILPLIHCVLPNSRFVHVKRNAVDNLLSIWMTPMKTGLPFLHRPEHLVFAYKEYVRLLAHLVEVMPNDRFQTFTYEDLTSDPELTIESMLRYLNLEAEEDCFHPEDNKRTVHTPSVFQVRQPINRRSQERWRRYQPWLGPFSELLGC